MHRTLEFWFDYSCPYAYLASTQVEAFAARLGASLTYAPMLLGGVFLANGTPQNLMGALSPAKAAHNGRDMQRWADLFGVPLAMPSAHPMRTVEALRGTLATGIDPRVVQGFFRAYWIEGRAPSEPDTMREVLAAAGHDADAVLARIHDADVKADLRARTDRAIARGIFGAPSYVVDGVHLYWGQDRMDFIAGDESPYLPQRKNPTMAHTLELYWDFSSPFSYLACTQAEALAARTGAKLVWRPMLLGGLYKTIGQVGVPMQGFSPAKQKYYLTDMQRWAAHWGVELNFPPSIFPMNTVKALRVYLALGGDEGARFREKAFHAYWVDDRDINDDGVLRELIGEHADEVLARTNDPGVKQQLIDATQAAVDAGVFGAPTWVVDGTELYWGQDRIALVEDALRR